MRSGKSLLTKTFPVLRAIEADQQEFIELWERQYADPRERLYEENIGKPLTRASVMALFEWKNGGKLSSLKVESVLKNYVSMIDKPLPSDIDTFLKSFGPSKGGAIWPIFWLHCCNQQFPIFDQHAYRAMNFIRRRQPDELEKHRDIEKVDLYLDLYVPFYRELDMPGRRADKALWAFGKFLKTDPGFFWLRGDDTNGETADEWKL